MRLFVTSVKYIIPSGPCAGPSVKATIVATETSLASTASDVGAGFLQATSSRMATIKRNRMDDDTIMPIVGRYLQ